MCGTGVCLQVATRYSNLAYAPDYAVTRPDSDAAIQQLERAGRRVRGGGVT